MPRIKKALKDETAARKAITNKKSLAHADSATITADRRGNDRRAREDRRKADVPVAADRRKLERREKVNRRRQIDPTTCERDYSDDEVEFMNAMEQYKRSSGRMFPTCSEVLEVLMGLGYEKRPRPDLALVAEINPETQPVSSDPPSREGAIFHNVGEG